MSDDYTLTDALKASMADPGARRTARPAQLTEATSDERGQAGAEDRETARAERPLQAIIHTRDEDGEWPVQWEVGRDGAIVRTTHTRGGEYQMSCMFATPTEAQLVRELLRLDAAPAQRQQADDDDVGNFVLSAFASGFAAREDGSDVEVAWENSATRRDLEEWERRQPSPAAEDRAIHVERARELLSMLGDEVEMIAVGEAEPASETVDDADWRCHARLGPKRCELPQGHDAWHRDGGIAWEDVARRAPERPSGDGP